MSNIVKVQFIFENCETLTYLPNALGKLNLIGISEKLFVQRDKIVKNKYVSAFELIMRANAVPCNSNLFVELDNLNDRFKDKDVAQICLIDENNVSETYLVKWLKNDAMYTHSNQRFNLTDKGNIQFTSHIKNKHVKKFSNIEYVDFYC